MDRMKHYKDTQNNLFGFENENAVPDGLTEITIEEAREIAAENNKLTPEQKAQLNEVLRKAAYTVESDPLFFRAQRGEATEQEWLDKIEEIKKRYPKS
jgi:hypothetical protein